jgi:hypothetical protein
MEFSKEQFIKIMSENYISDLDEMGKFWDKQNPISRPIKDDEGNLIGHDMRVDPFDDNSPRVNVIFTCDIQEFINSHPDLVAKLKEQYGNIKWTDDVCPKYNPHKKKRAYQPIPGAEDQASDIKKRTAQDASTGEKLVGSARIKRFFLNYLRNNLTRSEDNFNKELSKRSIPAIVLDDRKYFDRHNDVWTNDKVEFRITAFNTYESGKDFLQKVANRISGKTEENQDTEHLARQWNNIYRNWEETRKSDKLYQGKTDVFGLDVKGFKEGNFDVSMKMILEIKGEKIGESFIWTVSMVNKFGRKRPDEYRISGQLKPVELVPGGYLDEKKLVKSVSVPLEPNESFTPENTIMDDENVVKGLIDVINEFKSMIIDISPKTALKYATLKRSDVERVDENKEIKNVVKDIIMEVKKGYQIYHKSYTSAINSALEYAESRGYTYDKEETASEIGMGPKKPSDGKTNRFRIGLKKDDKEQRKSLHIQVYGMGDKYELNTYIN